MQPFNQLNGVAVALRRDNVDTDQVIPARFLKISRAEGLADALFRDLRFDAAGKPRAEFPMNDPARQGASILIGRRNFGVFLGGRLNRIGERIPVHSGIVNRHFRDRLRNNSLHHLLDGALLGKAGFRLNRVVPTASAVSVVEAVPA